MASTRPRARHPAPPGRRRRPARGSADQGRHHRLRAAVGRGHVGSAQLGAARGDHPRLQRLRPPGHPRPQDPQGDAQPGDLVEGDRRDHVGGEAPRGRQVPRRLAVHGQGRQGHLRPRAGPDQEDDRPGQPRQDQERRGDGRPHRPLQDRRPLPALRRAPHRARDAVGEGDTREGRRVDAGASDRDRPLQARQVGPQAGAPARPQRRLLGAEAGLQVRPDPDHPRAGHPDRGADLGRRRHHQGGPARSDGRDQQVGAGAHRHLPDPPHRHAAARPGRAGRPQPVHRRAGAAGRQPRAPTWTRSSSTC